MDLGTLSLGDALSPITRVRRLFTAGERGVWYDHSDLGALFQDSAGTTPVTAVTQPVGLMLDKSKGLVLGPELVTNGTFNTDISGWLSTGTAVWAAGEINIPVDAANQSASQNITVTPNVFQKVIIGKLQNGYLYLYDGTSDGSPALVSSPLTAAGSVIVMPTGTTLRVRLFSLAAQNSYFDNISVRELPGYHATQTTSTARPVLGTNLIDFDGVDDAVTLAGSGGGTTGFFLCTAVRPDGGAGAIRTIWSDAGTNTGYIVRLNASNQLEIAAGNGTAYTLAATTATLTVGNTYVVTAWDDGTNLNVQVNSGTVGTAARPVVLAGTSTATIGKDNGAATGFFNGAIYPLIYVKNGQNVDALDRAASKAYVAGKAGVGI